MKALAHVIIVALGLSLVIGACGAVTTSALASGGGTTAAFVKRDGDILYEDLDGDGVRDAGEDFRTTGMDFPSAILTKDTGDWGRLDDWEMEAALQSLHQMGARVTRTYTLPVAPTAGTYAAITGVGQLNEDTLRRLDKFLALAAQYDVRVIVPVIDAWPHVGGYAQFAALRGMSGSAFFTDPTLIQDFKNLLSTLANRVNYYTGVTYKNDPTILAWQLGNELDGASSWSASWEVSMTDYFAALVPNQLIMASPHQLIALPTSMMTDPNIDIIDYHSYAFMAGDQVANISAVLNNARGQKAVIIGEIENSATVMQNVLDLMLQPANAHFSAVLLWSLRTRTNIGGYYNHSENGFYSYHWPGGPVGQSLGDEVTKMALFREYAYTVNGLAVPALPAPTKPEILTPVERTHLKLKGSVGATHYEIQRASSSSGPWTTLTSTYADEGQPYSHDQYLALTPYVDASMPTSGVFYRARGINSEGLAGDWSATKYVGSTLSSMDDTSPSIQYSGAWTHDPDPNYYAQTKAVASTSGPTATVPFVGSRVEVTTRLCPACGKYIAYIDGALVSTIDTYSPTGAYDVRTFSRIGLSEGDHTLEIRPTGTRNVASTGTWIGIDRVVSEVTVDDSSASVTYNGSWTQSADSNYFGGTKSVASTVGATASVTFIGDQASLATRTCPACGKADVYLDGQLRQTVDTYDATGAYDVRTFSVGGLGGGTHTVEVRVTGTKNTASTGTWFGLDRITFND